MTLLQRLEVDIEAGDLIYVSAQHDAHLMAFLWEWFATYWFRHPETDCSNTHWRMGLGDPDGCRDDGDVVTIDCSVGGRPALCAIGLDMGNTLDYRPF
jgi:hypothetical protein